MLIMLAGNVKKLFMRCKRFIKFRRHEKKRQIAIAKSIADEPKRLARLERLRRFNEQAA